MSAPPVLPVPSRPPSLALTSVTYDVNQLVNKVLKVESSFTSKVSFEELMTMLQEARKVFMEQPSMVEVDPPIIVCGDIHGQFVDLIRIFDKEGFPPKANYLFLGDYVDRGENNLETIVLLFCYKIKYRDNFFLLRGNHECWTINRVYGFLAECTKCYKEKGERLWGEFQSVFEWMPLTATIGGRILCMHGGLSPFLAHLDQLRQMPRPLDPNPNMGMAMDLLWADPDRWTQGFKPNARGCSFVFGADVVKYMCEKLGLDFIVRAHQVVQDGYEFFADRRMVTLFSAPHYCGQFDNSAATMRVDADMKVSFTTYRPSSRPLLPPPTSVTSTSASPTSALGCRQETAA